MFIDRIQKEKQNSVRSDMYPLLTAIGHGTGNSGCRFTNDVISSSLIRTT